MKKRLTEEGVKRIRPVPGQQVDFFDQGFVGLLLRVSYGGTKTWRVVHYVGGKPRTVKIGRHPVMNVQQARDAARKFLIDPQAALARSRTGTFKEVAELFLRLYVEQRKLRSKAQIERCLKRYVYPRWASRPFEEIKRGDVTALLDEMVVENGARQADVTLAYIRKITRWHQTRTDGYVSPIVPGMNRAKSKDRKRKRHLDDDEIRAVWAATEDMGTYGALVRSLLLTVQRREKVGTMQHSHLNAGLWTIEVEDDREKGHAGAIRLPELALQVIESAPVIVGNSHVFAASVGDGPFNSFSQRKDELDAKLEAILPGMKPWVHHDLRRTGRSLMARAAVLPHIAERVMGHAVPELEETYDRYSYLDEKSAALQKLADMIASILEPSRANIVALNTRR